MIYISEAINILNDGQQHNLKFVSKTKGQTIEMTNVVVISSNHDLKKFNLKSVVSKQIRWVYYNLIIELDNQEVYI